MWQFEEFRSVPIPYKINQVICEWNSILQASIINPFSWTQYGTFNHTSSNVFFIFALQVLRKVLTDTKTWLWNKTLIKRYRYFPAKFSFCSFREIFLIAINDPTILIEIKHSCKAASAFIRIKVLSVDKQVTGNFENDCKF